MLKKQYVKSRKIAKITFEVSQDELPQDLEIKSVHLVGDFNKWDTEATPMKRSKAGLFRVILELAPEKEYEFRYLVNGEQWCNDSHADSYKSSGFDQQNCVVVTPASANG